MDQEPFVFTNEIVQELLANDWTLGVLSGASSPDDTSFDELQAGGWSDNNTHRIRSMDFVPGRHDDQHRRHRFVLHAWDGFLDHMIESRREHGWKNELTRTLAACCTDEEWVGHTTINPGAYATGQITPSVRRMLTFETYTIDRVEQLIRSALIDTRADELTEFDF